MFKRLVIPLFALLFGSGSIFSQTTTIATYTTGVGQSLRLFGAIDTSDESSCALSLNVPVPAGRYVTGVKVEYDYESLFFSQRSQQVSYLECITTNIKENSVTPGPNLNSPGVASYNRSGLTIANGVVPAGGLTFELHSFSSSGGAACSSQFNRINNNTFKIEVTHIAAPACLPPTALTSSNIQTNSADLNWTSGGATNWQLEYGVAGFTPGTGTLVNVTSKPYNLGGLSAATAYDFYVRDSCGLADVSFFSQKGSFRTACGINPLPYVQDFESSNWLTKQGFQGKGSIDTCYRRNLNSIYSFAPGPQQFDQFGTGPSVDHTTGSGKFIYAEFLGFGGAGPFNAGFVTPDIDLSSVDTAQLSFYYHAFGSGMGTMTVQISNNSGASYSNLGSIVGQQQTSKNANWEEQIYNLDSYVDDTVRLRFIVALTAFQNNSEFAIDDISIKRKPTCLKPSALSTTASTQNSVTLSWTSGGASNWQIEYGQPGFTQGTGTLLSASTNPTTISGLNPSSNYDFYLRDSCSATDLSEWIGPFTGSTLCGITVAPYVENFDNSKWVEAPFFNQMGTIDTCWTRTRVNYIFVPGPGFNLFSSGPSSDHTTGSGGFIQAERIGFSTATATAEIESPQIDLSALTIPELSFWYHMYGLDITFLEVEISNNNGVSFTNVLTLTGQKQNSKTDAWKEAIIDLSVYANDTIIIKFITEKTGFGLNARVSIDDVDIHEQPACPKPQNLVVQGSSSNSVTLSWLSGGAANWEVEYGSIGFTPGSGTRVQISSNPATISGLTPNSTYEFIVRDSCGIGSTSDWSSDILGKTNCLPVNAPYTEDFDGSDFTVGVFNTAGTINSCWRRDTTSSFLFDVGQNGTQAFNSGPNGDHTSGTGKFLYTRDVFGAGASRSDGEIYSPSVNLGPLTNPELRFWYHMFGQDIDSLIVEIWNGSTWTREDFKKGQDQTSSAAAWKEVIVNLASYTNDTIQIKFRGVRVANGFFNNIAIDDVKIDEQPNCPQPTQLVAQSIGATSIDFSWTSGGVATNYQFEYGAAGFTKGSGTIVNASSNPYTFNNLSPGVSYDFYLRDSCGANDFSTWLGPVTFATACLPITAPYLEDFETSDWTSGLTFNDSGTVNNCWTRVIIPEYIWRTGPEPFSNNFTGPSGDHTSGSGKYLFTESYFNFGGTAPFTAEIISPFIDLSGLTNPQLTFWYHMFGNAIGDFDVEISNGGAFTNIFSASGQQQTADTEAWLEEIISLSAYTNDTIRLKFIGEKANFSTFADIAIDDVEIDEAPSCPKPSNLTVQQISINTARLGWTSGGATNWQLEYGAPGFTPGTGTLVNVNSKPFTLTNLASGTAYDFYVRDSCSATDLSEWFGPVSDTTDCDVFVAPYTEDFEGSFFIPSNGNFFDIGSISPCWDRTSFGNLSWRTGIGTGQNILSGPDKDHTNGLGQYMFIRGFGSGNADLILTTPMISLDTLSTPELRYWYHMFGANISKLEIFARRSNASNWTSLSVITGAQQNNASDAWEEDVVSLSSYVGDSIEIRFRGYRTGFGQNHEIAIDDVWIGNSPTCTRPTSITTGARTQTTIALSFVGGGANKNIIKYRIAGSNDPFTFVGVRNTSNVVLTGLNSGTQYEIFVADSCSAGNLSLYQGPVLASTDCGIKTAPYTESFNSGQWVGGTGFQNTGASISPCWTKPTTSPEWGTRQGPTAIFSSGPSGGQDGKYIYIVSGSGNGFASITSPQIIIPASLNQPHLFFYYHMYGSQIDSLSVQINDGSGWTASSWSIQGQQQTSKTAAWKKDSIDLSAYSGDTIQVRFGGSQFGFQGDIAVDEVSILPISLPCPEPTALSFTKIGNNSVEVNWTSNSGASQIEVVPNGQSVGTGVRYSSSTSPFTINGLNPLTNYRIFVRDSCNTFDYSTWVSDTFTTTNCVAVQAAFVLTNTYLQINVDASTSVGADSIYWDFGDGTNSRINPSNHSYSGPGTYDLELIVENNCGNRDTLVQTITICDTLLADFTRTITGNTLDVDASISKNTNGYLWDFGDGTTDIGQTTSHTYNSAGQYTVELKVWNDCGDTLSQSYNINLCGTPIASWTYSILSSGANGMLVQFDGSASQNASSYSWTFGDGNTNNVSAIPQNLYATPGLFYLVRLEVANQCGQTDVSSFRLNQISLDEFELEQLIKIYPNPIKENLWVEWEEELEVQSIRISSLTGAIVREYKINNRNDKSFKINSSELSPASYIVEVISSEGVLQKQIIKVQ